MDFLHTHRRNWVKRKLSKSLEWLVDRHIYCAIAAVLKHGQASRWLKWCNDYPTCRLERMFGWMHMTDDTAFCWTTEVRSYFRRASKLLSPVMVGSVFQAHWPRTTWSLRLLEGYGWFFLYLREHLKCELRLFKELVHTTYPGLPIQQCPGSEY